MRLTLDLNDPDDVEFARDLFRKASSSSPTPADELHLDAESLEVAAAAGLVVSPADIPTDAEAPSLSLEDYRPSSLLRRGSDDDLMVNRDVWPEHHWLKYGHEHNNWYYRIKDSPADIMGLNDSTLYVRDPDSMFISVVNLHGRTLEAWEQLSQGALTPSDLDPDVRRKLADASLLVPSVSALTERIATCADELRSQRFTVLRNVINPAYCQWLTRYSLVQLKGGWLNKEQEYQPRQRWMRHNDPIMQTIHTGLTPLVRAIAADVDKPCRPSYSFLGIYDRGALLERHTDREQCRWNLSLLLGTSPDIEPERQWPIYIETTEAHCVRPGPGDAVMYSGTSSPHWREPLLDVDRYVTCFLFYVDEDYLGYTV